jgi:hypothetical protein
MRKLAIQAAAELERFQYYEFTHDILAMKLAPGLRRANRQSVGLSGRAVPATPIQR